MAEYEQSMTMQGAPDEIFAFVADVANLPAYLPTTTHAETQGDERVRVQGGGDGFQYDADGYLRANPDRRRLEWGADERYYAGLLEITPQGESRSKVTVRLTFRDRIPGTAPGEGPSDSDIEHGIRAALESIQSHVSQRDGSAA